MKPAFVFPLHDPTGLLWDRLPAGLRVLEPLAGRIVVGLTAETAATVTGLVDWLKSQDWVEVVHVSASAPVGEQFHHLYAEAARLADPRQIMHLCFPDRLLFALAGDHRAQFLSDVLAKGDDAPLLFERSAWAWSTHPRVYRDAEGLVTTLGRLLIGRELDFAWCHLAMSAQDLAECLPNVRRSDLSMMAELVWCVKDRIQTKAVDWLAWEDPFVLGCDGDALRAEREGSAAELDKRLSYVLPMLDVLASGAKAERHSGHQSRDPRSRRSEP